MATFDNIMNCSVGGTAFQLLGYSKSVQRSYADGIPSQEDITYTLNGEVQGANIGALATALSDLEASCEDGETLTITGLNNINLEAMDAATLTYGPRYSYSYGSDQSATHQQVTITVTGVIDLQAEGGGGSLPAGVVSVTKTVSTSKNVEELTSVATKGTVTTETGTSASAEAVALIPAAPAANYLRTSYQYEQENDADTKANYSAAYTELVTVFPYSGDNHVLDGESKISTTYDAHNRHVITYSYQYTGPYAETYVADRLASLRSSGNLVRVTIDSVVHKTRTVNATFEVLTYREGGDEAELLELVETIKNQRSAPLLDQRVYAGTAPLIFKLPDAGIVYMQSGRAIGLKKYPKPPDKKFATANLLDESVNFQRLNDQEFETTWEFPFLFDGEQGINLPSDRQDNNGFYS